MDKKTHQPSLILASASPRRQQLLRQLGLTFTVQVSQVNEDAFRDLPPHVLVQKLALAKALGVAETNPSSVVVGADTVVVRQGFILGKPDGPEDAENMLSLLSGSEHQVLTGVAVVQACSRQVLVDHRVTRVFFKKLSAEEISKYVATGEPLDKAGAYGIQGKGAALVDHIEGCYFNVVGLPLSRLVDMLKEFGIEAINLASQNA